MILTKYMHIHALFLRFHFTMCLNDVSMMSVFLLNTDTQRCMYVHVWVTFACICMYFFLDNYVHVSACNCMYYACICMYFMFCHYANTHTCMCMHERLLHVSACICSASNYVQVYACMSMYHSCICMYFNVCYYVPIMWLCACILHISACIM